MPGARRLAALAGAALALALLCVPFAAARVATTQPGKIAVVYFVIDDKQVVLQIFRKTPNDSGGSDLFPERYLVRGDFATFFLVNRGKKPHGLDFLGKKIASLKPGKTARITARALNARGSFRYSSNTDRGKAYKGVFTVY